MNQILEQERGSADERASWFPSVIPTEVGIQGNPSGIPVHTGIQIPVHTGIQIRLSFNLGVQFLGLQTWRKKPTQFTEAM